MGTTSDYFSLTPEGFVDFANERLKRAFRLKGHSPYIQLSLTTYRIRMIQREREAGKCSSRGELRNGKVTGFLVDLALARPECSKARLLEKRPGVVCRRRNRERAIRIVKVEHDSAAAPSQSEKERRKATKKRRRKAEECPVERSFPRASRVRGRFPRLSPRAILTQLSGHRPIIVRYCVKHPRADYRRLERGRERNDCSRV